MTLQQTAERLRIQPFAEFWLESGLPLAKAQGAYRDFVEEIETQIRVGK